MECFHWSLKSAVFDKHSRQETCDQLLRVRACANSLLALIKQRALVRDKELKVRMIINRYDQIKRLNTARV